MPAPLPTFAVPGTSVAWDDSFGATLGLQLVAAERGLVRARLPVVDRVRRPSGSVHGGVHASMAETLSEFGTTWGLDDPESRLGGSSTATTTLRAVHEGWLHATAAVRSAGRTQWVWDVDVTDDDETLVAVCRVVVSIRPGR